MFSNKVLYFPIKVVLGFLIFTEVFYLVGPIDFMPKNVIVLYLFLAVCNLAMFLGYRRAIKKSPITKYELSSQFIATFLFIAVFLKFYELSYIWSGHGIAVSFSSIIDAIIDPGKAYYSEASSFSGSGLLRLIVAPATWAAIPLGVFYWGSLRKTARVCVVLIIVTEVFVWLGIGVRKGLFDVLLIISFVALAKNAKVLDNPKSMRKGLVFISIVSFVFLVYFIYSNMSRGGRDFSDFSQMFLHRQMRDSYSESLPSWLVLSIMSIEDYICQGYDALNKALNIGIIQPVPFSSNWFTIGLAQVFTGQDIMNNTYLSILEAKESIDPSINWHTIYVWLANEYTFIGVPFIIYIIGYFFAQTWKDVIYCKNPIAYPLFALFLIMSFYAYANNQVLSSSFTPLFFWFIFYQFSKKRI